MSGGVAWANALQALALFVAAAGTWWHCRSRWRGSGTGQMAEASGEAFRRDTVASAIPCSVRDGRLLGGLDLAATLRAAPVEQKGLLAEADGGVVILAMAERLDAGTSAELMLPSMRRCDAAAGWPVEQTAGPVRLGRAG